MTQSQIVTIMGNQKKVNRIVANEMIYKKNHKRKSWNDNEKKTHEKKFWKNAKWEIW